MQCRVDSCKHVTHSNQTEVEESARKQCVNLEALNSLSSFRNQLLEKEEECERVQADLSAVQKVLAENIEERQNLQHDLYSNENSRQTLQNRLLSIQGTLAQKEYQALRKELEEANDDAQNSLESGNQKAKTETHSLLKRIQDSESGMKMVSETLHRMNVAHLQQPLSETLDQLVRMLQANNASEPTVGQERSPVRISETSARDKNTQMKHGARHIEAQTDTIADGTKTPTNHSNPSKQTGSIVPFSSIVQGLSPVRYAVAGNGPFDLSALTQTQERATSLQEPTVPARPEKRNSLTETAPGSKRQGANIEVHYITQSRPGDQGNKQSEEPVPSRKLTGEDVGSNILESSLNGGSMIRINRWTYRKRQREISMRQQETTSSRGCPANIVTQTGTGSELYDLRRSPTRLASGNSHTSSTIPNPDQMGTNRSKEGQDGRREVLTLQVTNTTFALVEVPRSEPNLQFSPLYPILYQFDGRNQPHIRAC
ncbi:hypothetical protein BDW68DRAFT_190643 [Aspergillus falconensis]